MLIKSTFCVCSNLSSLKVIVRFLMWIYLLCLFVGVSHSIDISEDKITLRECYDMIQENKSAIETQSPHDPKCETHGCVKVAAQIANYINVGIDPCDNFYNFANGHYLNDESDDTGDYESRGFYSTVSNLVNKKVGPLLSEPVKPNEWKPFKLAKNFYKSCIDPEINVKSILKQFIDNMESLGGWPVIKSKSWRSRDFNLNSVMKKVAELGFGTNVIFDLTGAIDQKNTTNKLIKISSGNYAITEIDNEKAVAEYRNKILRYAAFFINKIDKATRARMKEEINRVVAFEIKLIKISSSSSSSSSSEEDDDDIDDIFDINDINDIDDDDDDDIDEDIVDDNVVDIDYDHDDTISTIKELQQSYPYLRWLEYISEILPSGLNVTENEPILNSHPQFFDKLGTVLKSTSNRTIANYILWRVVSEMDDIDIEEKGKERRNKCIDLTTKTFPIAVGLLYSRKYFNEQSRQAVIDLVEDIRGAFIDILRNVTWMDDNTQETAIAKAKNILAHVGYPNELYEGAELNEYFQDLEIEPDDFLANVLRFKSFDYNQTWKSLRKPLNRSGLDALGSDPTKANAFYYPPLNIIAFPVAILHELFFSEDRPKYINYASLGNTVGHEITHGFDDAGRKYDLNGNLINWWSLESQKNFTRKAKCFINQYSSYTDSKTNLMIPGKKTLNENIADNGGTRAAYYAYLNWIERNEPEKLIPGVKYNQKQLFWISYAQAESSVNGIATLAYLIENDVHAPAEFRVNGVVSNSEEFARDFNCPVGTKMNPAEKCRIW